MVLGKLAGNLAWVVCLGVFSSGCKSDPPVQDPQVSRARPRGVAPSEPVPVPRITQPPARPPVADSASTATPSAPASTPAVALPTSPSPTSVAVVPAVQSTPTGAPPTTVLPASSESNPPNEDPATSLRRLARDASARAAQLDSYNARLRRREQVKGKDQPEEIILLKFRQQPFSVHMKWLGSEGEGRQVIYVKGRYGDKIHTLVGKRDNLLFAGKHMTFATDDAMVQGASRHSITEAGLQNLCAKFSRLLAANESGDHHYGTVAYQGVQKRPEFQQPLELVEQVMPTNAERLLPRGGRRHWFFDTKEHLPLLVIAYDETGHQVEYYCYDYIQWPVKLDDQDFDPAQFDVKKR